MKLKLAMLATAILVSAYADAATRHVHKWTAGGSKDWSGYISLTNTCNNHDADITIKYWKSDGTLLTNKTLESAYSTNSNGELSFTLTPHQSITVTAYHSFFGSSNTVGSARVTTSYSEPGTSCVVGGYGTYSTPFGFNESYHLNNGRRF